MKAKRGWVDFGGMNNMEPFQIIGLLAIIGLIVASGRHAQEGRRGREDDEVVEPDLSAPRWRQRHSSRIRENTTASCDASPTRSRRRNTPSRVAPTRPATRWLGSLPVAGVRTG